MESSVSSACLIITAAILDKERLAMAKLTGRAANLGGRRWLLLGCMKRLLHAAHGIRRELWSVCLTSAAAWS